MEVDVLPEVCYHYTCKKNRKGKSAFPPNENHIKSANVGAFDISSFGHIDAFEIFGS